MAEQTLTGRRGSRWYGEEPDGAEVAEWFTKSVRLHEGMDHEHYVDGIVLIPQREQPQVVLPNGQVGKGPERLVLTPYAKVETRQRYFWDLCELRNWLGAVEPVPQPRIDQGEFSNASLPTGFFRHPVKGEDGKVTAFLGCSYRCSVKDRGRLKEDVFLPPVGTKIVPTLVRGYQSRTYADVNAVMKAETGAVGRALGFAGMLVIPGSGIATAEDMAEMVARTGSGEEVESPSSAALPEEPKEDGLVARAKDLRARLKKENKDRYDEIVLWADERGVKLESELSDGPALRGIVRQMERALEPEAKK